METIAKHKKIQEQTSSHWNYLQELSEWLYDKSCENTMQDEYINKSKELMLAFRKLYELQESYNKLVLFDLTKPALLDLSKRVLKSEYSFNI